MLCAPLREIIRSAQSIRTKLSNHAFRLFGFRLLRLQKINYTLVKTVPLPVLILEKNEYTLIPDARGRLKSNLVLSHPGLGTVNCKGVVTSPGKQAYPLIIFHNVVSADRMASDVHSFEYSFRFAFT